MDSVHLRRWAHDFARRGFAVSVVCARPPRLAYSADISVYPLGAARADSFAGGARRSLLRPPGLVRLLLPQKLRLQGIRTVLDGISPDIIHGHYVSNWGYVAQQTGRRPLVTTIWGSDVLRDPTGSPLTRYVVRETLTKSDLITYDSGAVADAAVALGAHPDRLLHVVLGVDDAFLKASARAPSNSQRDQIVLSHRSLGKSLYNVDTIIQAMKFVSAAHPEARLLVGNDGVLRPGLEGLAAELGISRRVTFVGDAATPEELATRLGQAAVHVSVPSSDGTSVTLLEAMAAQAYPIVSDLPANREWISSESGELVPARDPRALAEAILRALRDPAMRARAVATNLEKVFRLGLWTTNMNVMEAAYRKLLDADHTAVRVGA